MLNSFANIYNELIDFDLLLTVFNYPCVFSQQDIWCLSSISWTASRPADGPEVFKITVHVNGPVKLEKLRCLLFFWYLLLLSGRCLLL